MTEEENGKLANVDPGSMVCFNTWDRLRDQRADPRQHPGGPTIARLTYQEQ